MYVVGLTGGIGSGKSSVARVLVELRAPVCDLDAIARRLVEPGSPTLAALAAHFGARILRADGSLDRAALAALAFSDPAARARLEAITRPAIRRAADEQLERWRREGRLVAVADVPLLYETGEWLDRVDEVWVVTCAPEQQVERLRLRSGLGEEEARARIAAQLPLGEKARRADRVIDNSGPWPETEAQVRRLWAELLERLRAGAE